MALKKKQPKELDPFLVDCVNRTRTILMHRNYYVLKVIRVDDNIVDIIAIFERLLESERLRIRLIKPNAQSGLSIPEINRFFYEQSRVFDLKGILIALGPIGVQAKRLVDKKLLRVFDLDWFEKNMGLVDNPSTEISGK